MKKSKDIIEDFPYIISKLKHAGVHGSTSPNRSVVNKESIGSIDERISVVLGLLDNKERKTSNMLCFIMYDISSNKVRRYVVKYLEQRGCLRIQRSIFLADLEPKVYEEIKNDLAEVQAVYENEDSILVVPISTEYLKAMKIIGQNINIDVVIKNKNTLFF